MRLLLAWAARGVVLLSVGWLVLTFMPREWRQRLDNVIAAIRR